MKKCKKCGITMDLNSFHKKNLNKDGLTSICKKCTMEYNKKYYSSNKLYFLEKNKQWNRENREIKNKKATENYYNNKEFFSERAKEYRSKNREKLNRNKKEWYDTIPIEKKREYRRMYSISKKSSDPLYKLKCNFRSYISSKIRNIGSSKDKKSVDIIGLSFSDLKLYLESKFEIWMSWDNYGKYNGEFNYGWDIDHIVPLSKIKTEECIYKLNHYTNLQPLCSKINRDVKKDN